MKLGSTLAIVLWLAGLGAALHAVTARTWSYAKRDFDVLATPPLVDVDTRVLDLLTLGYRNVYDDFVYLWTLQMLADTRLGERSPEAVQASLRAVTRHQPKIETMYMLGCFVLAFDLKRPDLCEPVMLDGLKALPDGWRIPLTQGFIHTYELKDAKNGAMYYGLAASRPAAPAFVGRQTAKLIAESQLSVEDLRETVARLLDDPNAGPEGGQGRRGSRFGDFLQSLKEERP